MAYTDNERRLLQKYFSVVDGPEHADVYLVRDLPPEVAATLNGVYSRSSKSMRDNFLDRLKLGLEAAGRKLEDLEVPSAAPDLLTALMADRSGQFLKTYAIDHGHNSLREGSVVHFAVERVSQLVTRFVQRERRCSFEESSTRYISFGAESHWRDPDVMAAGGEIAAAYDEILRATFELYLSTSEKLLQHLRAVRPLGAGEKEGPWLRTLRAEAFDAARYLLTPAISTKWGMVCDARTLADVVTELLSHPLAEFRTVGARMKQEAEKVLPTLLVHARENPFLGALHALLPARCQHVCREQPAARGAQEGSVTLVAHDHDLDVRLLAALLYEHAHTPLSTLQQDVAAMPPAARQALLQEVFAGRGNHDAWPAALEGASPFEFEVLLDFGAYRDIGRHRKGFQQQQALTVRHGFALPPLLVEAGLDGAYREVLERTAGLQERIAERFPLAAGYVTPFAFLQRVRITFDPRQLAYFIELRSGPEGHFAYRRVALDMFAHVQRVSPLFAQWIRAKVGDAFLGRMQGEQTADDRRLRRMKAAGDA
jgi:thymidylate synthase ThyX